MEYKFKLTVDEYANVLKLLCQLDKKQTLMMNFWRIITPILSALWCIFYTKKYGLNQGLEFSFWMFTFILIVLLFASNKNMHKRRVRVVKKQMQKNPSLSSQSVSILNNDAIEYKFNKKTLTSNIEDISKIIEQDDLLAVLDCGGELCAIMPLSYFETENEKIHFLKKLKK